MQSPNHFRAYKLAVEFYRATRFAHVPTHLKEQLRRASSSIALNLAEGSGRELKQDRRRFFSMAMGSIREAQAIAELESEAFRPETKLLLDQLAAATYRLLNPK